MNRLAYLAVLAASLLPVAGNASVVFDNGGYSGSQVGRYNMTPWTMFEDFTLSSSTTITGFQWSQHDQAFAYNGTTLSLFNGLPSVGSQLYSASHVATRTPNGSPILFVDYAGFDYEIDGLSLVLSAGTYYFGISNSVAGGGWTWDETTGSAQTIAGRWQSLSAASPGNFISSEDSVFRVMSDAISVPEPGSLALVGIALLALYGRKGRSATQGA